MPDTPKPQKNENQGTFFLSNKQNREENIRAQNEDQMITNAMGGPLVEQADANIFQNVLHIACGSGDWMIEAAQRYPQMSLVGIDINAHIIDYARERAIEAQVAERVKFQEMDALRPLEFPTGSFDLVNQRLGVSFIRTWEWPGVIAEMMRVSRPGGMIRLTEPQIIHENKGSTSNPALTKLHKALVCSLYRSGHLFEESTTGVTAHLAPLLTHFGCREVQTREYALDFQAGTPEWQFYYSNALLVMQGWRTFLTKRGCIGGDYDTLYQQALKEIGRSNAHSIWTFLTVWGQTPLSL